MSAKSCCQKLRILSGCEDRRLGLRIRHPQTFLRNLLSKHRRGRRQPIVVTRDGQQFLVLAAVEKTGPTQQAIPADWVLRTPAINAHLARETTLAVRLARPFSKSPGISLFRATRQIAGPSSVRPHKNFVRRTPAPGMTLLYRLPLIRDTSAPAHTSSLGSSLPLQETCNTPAASSAFPAQPSA